MRDLPDLFVQSRNVLLRLNLKDYQFDPALASKSGENPPIPQICLTYDGAGPLSPVTNVMKLGKRVFIVGGESKEIYEYDPSENSREKSADLIFNKIKVWPTVEEIEGKFYVFNIYPSIKTPTLSLEVLDPSSYPNLRWEVLPDPGFRFFSHFVHRHKLYFLTDKQMCYFDTCLKKWCKENDMFKYRPFLRYQMKIPRFGRRACGSEDIIVALKEVDEHRDYFPCMGSRCFLYAYLYSKDSILLAYQNLGHVFGEHELYAESAHLIAMGDHKFCVVAVGTLPQYRCFSKLVKGPYPGNFYFTEYVIGVSVFNVSKLPNADQLLVKTPTVHMPPADDDDAFVDPADPTPREDEILFLSIEKTFFFDARNLGAVYVVGAFFH